MRLDLVGAFRSRHRDSAFLFFALALAFAGLALCRLAGMIVEGESTDLSFSTVVAPGQYNQVGPGRRRGGSLLVPDDPPEIPVPVVPETTGIVVAFLTPPLKPGTGGKDLGQRPILGGLSFLQL